MWFAPKESDGNTRSVKIEEANYAWSSTETHPSLEKLPAMTRTVSKFKAISFVDYLCA